MSTESPKPGRCHGRMKYVAAVALVLALGGAGLVWAGQKAVSSLAAAHGHGGGFELGGRAARLHVEFAVDRALRAAEATPEQRDRVDAIVQKAFADHDSFRDQHRELHTQALALLTAPTIDRTQLESLRARHMQIAEEGSRHIATVVADIADVLTPEQRQKLAAHVRQMFE